MNTSPASTRHAAVFIALLLTACLLPTAARAADHQDDPKRFEGAIQQFEAWDRKNAVPENPVLFVGSSSIRMWDTRESFPDLPVINRGFGGSQLSDVIHFADRVVLPYKPRVILLYCGDNDIAKGKDADRVLADFDRLVKIVREALPETRLIYLPIKPSRKRWSLWPQMKQANDMVRARCEQDAKLAYADTATPMLPPGGGMPPEDLFLKDGLHMTAKGYRLWAAAIQPVLEHALR